MAEFLDAYAETDDLNEQYGLLKDEIARLRGWRDGIEFFDEERVEADIRDLNERVDGDLLVFLANDYGRPRAYRREGVSRAAQNVLRAAILANKYDGSNDDLNESGERFSTTTPPSTKSSSRSTPRRASDTTCQRGQGSRRTSSPCARWSVWWTTRRTASRPRDSR